MWILVACVALIGCTPGSAPVVFNAAARKAGEQVRIPSDGLMLRGWLLKPTGSGPFPSIVYNHGSVRDPSIDYFGDLALWFQAHGYVVLFPFRRGAGGSEGPYWADVVSRNGEARDRAVVAQLEKENDDVVNAIAWLRAKPYVDSARVIVAGCSFGGIHTLLAAERPLDLYAALDFAGGAMSWQSSAALRERLSVAADHAKVPVLFAQAENDFDTSPSRILSERMRAAGHPFRMRIYPPHGRTHGEGHGGFCVQGMSEWGEDVLAFLRGPR